MVLRKIKNCKNYFTAFIISHALEAWNQINNGYYTYFGVFHIIQSKEF